MAYASLSPNINDRIQPLIPALKSNWLIAHVITCFLGYAGFAVAFGINFMYLLKARDAEKKSRWLDHFPDTDVLDELTYQVIMFGFLFLSIGIITGAVWANSAWGSYWSWGSERNMVFNHLVYIRHLAPCQTDAWMARQADRLPFHPRFHGGSIHLFRSEPAPRSAQLRDELIFP